MESLAVGLTSVIVLGIAGQWIAWRFRVPSILLLLAIGLLAGPVCESIFARRLVHPDHLFGDLLFPLVSLFVGLILFEGGLSLRFEEIRHVAGPLWRLLTLGALATWALSATAAYYLLGMTFEISLLFGAILTVTGPTVVQPLLRQIRPSGNAGSMAKWEGIVIDPIGAVLAVLVYDVIGTLEARQWELAFWHGGQTLLTTCLAGALVGLIAAFALAQVLQRHWVPDYLDSPVVLMVVVAAFTLSNELRHESGLVAVTIMGIFLANQRSNVLHAVYEFKERLTVLLISVLFILLSARLDLEQVTGLGWQAIAFAAVLILIIRPVSVWLATVGSSVTWRERAFLAWMAPRGIVAASVASVFSLGLGESGAKLAPMMFFVILVTVTVYGMTAGPLARRLGLALVNPQGVLIAGAHRLAREIAKSLNAAGIQVVLVDNNYRNVQAARIDGLRTEYANILSEQAINDLDFWGLGRFMALTPNAEVNSLAAGYLAGDFGSSNVYQLPHASSAQPRLSVGSEHLRGRLLFAPHANHDWLQQRLDRGATVKSTRITDEFTWQSFQEQYGDVATVMFVVSEQKKLTIVHSGSEPTIKAGNLVISLIRSSSDSGTKPAGTET